MESTSTHQSLLRGLQIVEIVATMAEPPTLSEIARKINLKTSTTYHILKALVDFGYLVQETDTLTYSLSSKLFRITRQTWTNGQLAEIAAPFLDRLGSLTNESASLAVFQDGQVTVAAKREQKGPLRVVQEIGETRLVYCTAVGKVLAAWLPEQEVENIIERTEFKRMTAKTITSPIAFRRELARIRKEGAAFDNEEHIKGIRCLAVPVKDYTGKVRAALCIVGPKDDLSPRRRGELQSDLLAVAADLSARLGYKAGKRLECHGQNS